MFKNMKYVVIFSVIVELLLLEVIEADNVNSERKPRALAFQPFKSSSADLKLSNFFIDKYFNELKGANGGSNGPALFPNDGPPPPRPPLVVTSRPLTEQIARSELNSSPQDNTSAKTSVKRPSLYEILINRFGNNAGEVKDLDRHPYVEIWKKSKDSLHAGAQNKRDSVEELTSLPPIFKALGSFARNKLRKQNEQKYKEYSDEYQDGDGSAGGGRDLKVFTKPRNNYRENNSQFDKSQEYAFSYAVKDDHTGDDFSHKQSSSGQATNGEYRVRLPDGRMQVVTFTADEGGYKADVRYDDVQLTSPERGVQNIQSNRLDYNENTVRPIVESEEYEQIQSSKEYYEDYGVDYGKGKPISNEVTPTSYTNDIGVTNGAKNDPFKLGRIIVPVNKHYDKSFPIVRYTSTPKSAYDFDYTNKDVVEITPKPYLLGQYVTQEPTLFDRVTPNYLSIINQIPFSTKQTILQADTTDESINNKQYDPYTYTTTKAPPLKAVSNHMNESTRISLLDGFRNIFKSTIAPFTYKPLVNSYNNFRFNPSTTLPPATNFNNNFNYNPSTSTPIPFNSYKTYKYSSSTPTPINYYSKYNYSPSISTANPVNSYSKYNHIISTPKPIIDYNFKYNPSSILQQSNSYQTSTFKPDLKLDNDNLKPTFSTILANKLNENNYGSNSYYTNQYSPDTVFNHLGLKDENKYFNGNGVFPYASASNNIASTARNLDYINKLSNNSTENANKTLKPKHTVKLTIENLKLTKDNTNGTSLNKTGHSLPNLHHTVTPNLYSYNNYGHLDTKKY